MRCLKYVVTILLPNTNDGKIVYFHTTKSSAERQAKCVMRQYPNYIATVTEA